MTTVDRQLSPRIVSLATAVPPHRVPQAEAVEFFNRFFDIPPAQRQQLTNVFLNAEIDSRFAAAPVHWYEQRHDFEQKNDEYIDSAVGLLKQVAVESLATANLDCTDIDMIVTVSTTGIAVPALDARLMEELRFRRNVQRLPLFGLGCAGGVLGLARAAACARAQPGSRSCSWSSSSAASRSAAAIGLLRTSSPRLSSATEPLLRCCPRRKPDRQSRPGASTPGPAVSTSWAGTSRGTGSRRSANGAAKTGRATSGTPPTGQYPCRPACWRDTSASTPEYTPETSGRTRCRSLAAG